MRMDIDQHVRELLKAMGEGVYEKEHILAMSLLSAVAGETTVINTKIGLLTSGKGLFSPAVYIEQYPYATFTYESFQDRGYLKYKSHGDGWVIHFLIPKSEFSKYTNFTIVQGK